MKTCQNCTKRFVGCHSQCQLYIVNKVINTYKREKLSKEKDLSFNDTHYGRMVEGNVKRHSDFKRKTFKG